MVERTFGTRLVVRGDREYQARMTAAGRSGKRAMDAVTGSTKPANRGLVAVSRASGELQGSLRGMAARAGPAGAALSALGPGGLAAAAGIGAVVIGLRELARGTEEAIGFADEIGKTADSIGVTTDALQEYRFAADLAGVATQALDTGLAAFSKRLGELRAGTGSLNTILNKMDEELKASLIAADSTEDALDLLFRAMGELENQTDRAALSAAAFGRTAGVEMTNLVRDGADSLEEMKKQARDLGIVLDESLIRSAEDTKDELTILSTVIDANLNRALLDLAPILVRLTELWAGFASAVASVFGSESGPNINTELAAVDRGLNEVAIGMEKLNLLLEPGPDREQKMTALLAEQNRLLEERARIVERMAGAGQGLGVIDVTPGAPAPPIPRRRPADLAGPLEAFGGVGPDLLELDRMTREYGRTAAEVFDETAARVDTLGELTVDLADETGQVSDAARRFGFTMASAFEDAIVAGEDWSGVLQGLGDDLTRIIVRLTVIEPLARSIANAFDSAAGAGGGGGFLGLVGPGLDLVSSFFGGGAATGRAATAGTSLPGGIGGFQHGGVGRVPGTGPADSVLGIARLTPGEPFAFGPAALTGAGGVKVLVQVINNAGVDVETEESTGPQGETLIRVVLNSVAKDIQRGGTVGRAIQGTFAARPTVALT